MILKNNRKLIISICILTSFILLVISTNIYLNIQHNNRKEARLTPETIEYMSPREVKDYLITKEDIQPLFPLHYILPFMAFIGLFVGTLVYYIMSDKVIQKDQNLKNNSKLILNFLTGQERKVIETLLENNGKVQQYELSHLPNLNKVKTHRILLNLEQKKVIHKEKLGKINRIVLNKELYDVLKN